MWKFHRMQFELLPDDSEYPLLAYFGNEIIQLTVNS